MIRLALAILEVATGRAGRIAAPGRWRDVAGLKEGERTYAELQAKLSALEAVRN